MDRKAFTLLELVFVIVVIGVLAVLAIPRLERDIRQEAGDSILSSIRYAQHMALMDNVIDSSNTSWQKAFWRFGFRKCSDTGLYYYVGSDKDTEGNIDAGEEAIDPANGKAMIGIPGADCAKDMTGQVNASPNIFITKKYSISDGNIAWSSGCGTSGAYIGFDNLGRPHRGYAGKTAPINDYSTLLENDCDMTVTFDSSGIDPLVIRIEKETGTAFIVGQEGS